MLSPGNLTVEEIAHNLKEVLQPYRDTLRSRACFSSGLALFWDKINDEDAACYFPHSDSVGGLCQEHSPVWTSVCNLWKAQ